MPAEILNAKAFLGFGKHNRNHPELKSGEVFIGNTTPPLDTEIYPYKSCRLGDVAYHTDGHAVDPKRGWRPVFVLLIELEEEAVEKVRLLYGRSAEDDGKPPVAKHFVEIG